MKITTKPIEIPTQFFQTMVKEIREEQILLPFSKSYNKNIHFFNLRTGKIYKNAKNEWVMGRKPGNTPDFVEKTIKDNFEEWFRAYGNKFPDCEIQLNFRWHSSHRLTIVYI